MANKENGKETRTSVEEINDSLSSVEQKIEANKKHIGWALGGIFVVAALILGYYYLISVPNTEKAKEAISKADTELAMGQDSLALKDYQNVAKEYSNSAANRANLNAAILLYQKGKYQEAINYLDSYDPEGQLVGPASQSLYADCYVNLKNYDKAISYFDKAISLSKDNALYTPVFMMKKATVLRELKKYKEELNVLQSIKDKFPEFGTAYQVDIDKYIARAQEQAQ